MNDDHGGSESVLLKRSILIFAVLEGMLQFVCDGLAECSFAFPVDEHDFSPFLMDVAVDGFAENIQLVLLLNLVVKKILLLLMIIVMVLYLINLDLYLTLN